MPSSIATEGDDTVIGGSDQRHHLLHPLRQSGRRASRRPALHEPCRCAGEHQRDRSSRRRRMPTCSTRSRRLTCSIRAQRSTVTRTPSICPPRCPLGRSGDLPQRRRHQHRRSDRRYRLLRPAPGGRQSRAAQHAEPIRHRRPRRLGGDRHSAPLRARTRRFARRKTICPISASARLRPSRSERAGR